MNKKFPIFIVLSKDGNEKIQLECTYIKENQIFLEKRDRFD